MKWLIYIVLLMALGSLLQFGRRRSRDDSEDSSDDDDPENGRGGN